jgi:hypothetical protein
MKARESIADLTDLTHLTAEWIGAWLNKLNE